VPFSLCTDTKSKPLMGPPSNEVSRLVAALIGMALVGQRMNALANGVRR